MVDLVIRNLNPIEGKEVRIYRVSKEGTNTFNDQFSPLDGLGLSAGINLVKGYVVPSEGALNHAGVIEFTSEDSEGSNPLIVTENGVFKSIYTEQDMVAGLEALGLNVYVLSPFVPKDDNITCTGPNATYLIGNIDAELNTKLDVYLDGVKLNPIPANPYDMGGLLREHGLYTLFTPFVNRRGAFTITNMSMSKHHSIRLVTSSETPDYPLGLPESIGSVDLLNPNTSSAEIRGCVTNCTVTPGIDESKVQESFSILTPTTSSLAGAGLMVNCANIEFEDDIPEGESTLDLYPLNPSVSERIRIEKDTSGDQVKWTFSNITNEIVYVGLYPFADDIPVSDYDFVPDPNAISDTYVVVDKKIYFLLAPKQTGA